MSNEVIAPFHQHQLHDPVFLQPDDEFDPMVRVPFPYLYARAEECPYLRAGAEWKSEVLDHPFDPLAE